MPPTYFLSLRHTTALQAVRLGVGSCSHWLDTIVFSNVGVHILIYSDWLTMVTDPSISGHKVIPIKGHSVLEQILKALISL